MDLWIVMQIWKFKFSYLNFALIFQFYSELSKFLFCRMSYTYDVSDYLVAIPDE